MPEILKQKILLPQANLQSLLRVLNTSLERLELLEAVACALSFHGWPSRAPPERELRVLRPRGFGGGGQRIKHVGHRVLVSRVHLHGGFRVLGWLGWGCPTQMGSSSSHSTCVFKLHTARHAVSSCCRPSLDTGRLCVLARQLSLVVAPVDSNGCASVLKTDWGTETGLTSCFEIDHFRM